MEEDGESCPMGLLLTAVHWIEFLPAESVAACCIACISLRQTAEEDRVWKDLCRRRWSRVNAGPGGHRRAYASINGWRNPSLRRTILSTSDAAQGILRRTRAAEASGQHAKKISAMDVGPSSVVVCSADYAWYYRAPQGDDDDPRDELVGEDSGPGGGSASGGHGKFGKGAKSAPRPLPQARTPAVRGFPLLSSSVTEARFSVDEERCFFGTATGQIHVHERGDDEAGEDSGGAWNPTAFSKGQTNLAPAVALVSPTGRAVAIRQVMTNFEGGCPRGSRLGVLCRPPSGWQSNGDGFLSGFLFLVDSHAQATARSITLGCGRLGGQSFPPMTRGGAAVSAAPLSSEDMPFDVSAGDLFAVGFGGGSVALVDGRCGESHGMVAGFVTQHRWLERLRCAGPLLMASYGRSKHVETWDIRKLPSSPASSPPRLPVLACASNSPDFWVEPSGLAVAVYGAPRNSQRFGAKHATWPWPRPRDLCRNPDDTIARVCHTGVGRASSASIHDDFVRGAVGRGAGGVECAGEAGVAETAQAFFSGAEVGTARGRMETVVPGVVSDDDYRLRLSTGIKFTDSLMATVLDCSRVLVDEVVVGGRSGGGGIGGHGSGLESVGSVFLSG